MVKQWWNDGWDWGPSAANWWFLKIEDPKNDHVSLFVHINVRWFKGSPILRNTQLATDGLFNGSIDGFINEMQ